jgi:multidrug efflux pump subunit AcrB
VSVVISGIVALTLTPSLAALLLKSTHQEPARPFRLFNRAFDRLTGLYEAAVTLFLRRVYLSSAVIVLMLAATGFLFLKVPGSLVPKEDQGYVLMVTSLPPASSLSRTKQVLSVERIIGPDTVDRSNIFPSAKILGNPAPGFSSGQSLAAMQDIVAKVLGSDYSIGWTGSAYQEITTAGTG